MASGFMYYEMRTSVVKMSIIEIWIRKCCWYGERKQIAGMYSYMGKKKLWNA